ARDHSAQLLTLPMPTCLATPHSLSTTKPQIRRLRLSPPIPAIPTTAVAKYSGAPFLARLLREKWGFSRPLPSRPHPAISAAPALEVSAPSPTKPAALRPHATAQAPACTQHTSPDASPAQRAPRP